MKYKTLESCFHDPGMDEKAEYEKRFSQENTCHLALKIHDYPAFFTITSEVFQLCCEIQQQNAEVAKLTARIPSLDTLLFRCLLQEIQMSNDIEGVHSSRKELLAIQNRLIKQQAHTRFAGQLRQYEALFNEKPKRPADSHEIRSIYDALLMEDVRADNPENLPDGECFRKDSVCITNGQDVIYHGIVPEDKIISALDSVLVQLAGQPAIIAGSVFHFVFEYVHPFYDGNGRMGRYLSTKILAENLELAGVLQLSLVLRENKSKYYKAFRQCESKMNCGDLTPFLIIFLELILLSFDSAIDLLHELSADHERGTGLIKSLNLSKRHEEFLELMLSNLLFGYQSLSIADISAALSVSSSTARNLVQKHSKYLYPQKDGRIHRFTLHRNFLHEDG